jgi:hypothetical protein
MKRTSTLFSSLILFILVFFPITSCDEDIINEFDDFIANCTGSNLAQFETLLWAKDGEPVDLDLITPDPEELQSYLYLTNVTARDVGEYECFSDGDKRISLHETYLSVHSNDSLLVPVEESERLIMVPAGRRSVIPCRPTHPDVKLTLLGQTQEPINLEKAMITYDPKVGFIISKGKLKHHNGIAVCMAEYGNHTEDQYFHMVFSFTPATTGVPTPEIAKGPSRWWMDEDAFMSCSVTVNGAAATVTKLVWRLPVFEAPGQQEDDEEVILQGGRIRIVTKKNQINQNRVKIKSDLIIYNVTYEDAGMYACEAQQESEDGIGIEMEYEQRSIEVSEGAGIHWDLSAFLTNVTVHEGKKGVRWVIGLETPFKPNVKWVGPNGQEINNNLNKYSLIFTRPQKGNPNKIQAGLIWLKSHLQK